MTAKTENLQQQLERNLLALELDTLARPGADRTRWIEEVWEIYWILTGQVVPTCLHVIDHGPEACRTIEGDGNIVVLVKQ